MIGPWLAGYRYGLADIYALPFYRWGRRIGIDMAGHYPRWTHWAGRMLGRAAVQDALVAEGLESAEFVSAVLQRNPPRHLPGRGTTRRVVEGDLTAEEDPSTALRAVPLPSKSRGGMN